MLGFLVGGSTMHGSPHYAVEPTGESSRSAHWSHTVKTHEKASHWGPTVDPRSMELRTGTPHWSQRWSLTLELHIGAPHWSLTVERHG